MCVYVYMVLRGGEIISTARSFKGKGVLKSPENQLVKQESNDPRGEACSWYLFGLKVLIESLGSAD